MLSDTWSSMIIRYDAKWYMNRGSVDSCPKSYWKDDSVSSMETAG